VACALSFHQPDDWQSCDEDERHSQLAGHERHTIRQEWLDNDDVERRRAAPLQQVPHFRVAVDLVAYVSASTHPLESLANGRAPPLYDVLYLDVPSDQQFLGQVYLSVVIPLAVTVRSRKRRKCGDSVSVVNKRPQHAAHEVPVTYTGHRLHGQYPRGVCSARQCGH